MTFIESLIGCSSQDDLYTLLKNTHRDIIIDSLLDYSNQLDTPEYLGQLSFNSDRTKSFIDKVSSFPCCEQVKYFLLSLLGDPELHWRCSNMIIPPLYWYYRTFAPINTTIYKVNAIGLSLSHDFSVPCDRDYLYSVESINLPTDIVSPSYLAFLSPEQTKSKQIKKRNVGRLRRPTCSRFGGLKCRWFQEVQTTNMVK